MNSNVYEYIFKPVSQLLNEIESDPTPIESDPGVEEGDLERDLPEHEAGEEDEKDVEEGEESGEKIDF